MTTDNTTIAGNEKIHVFMGNIVRQPGDERFLTYYYNEEASELDYQTNYNSLMPVVEKIEKMGYEYNIHCFNFSDGSRSYQCTFLNHKDINDSSTGRSDTLCITAIWLAVVELIEKLEK